MARPGEHPSLLDLDRLAEVEQRLGLELGADADRRVEEVGLVEDLADRLGLVQRGDRLDLDAVLAQQLDRRAQVGRAVADVRAEPQVAGPLAPARRSCDPSLLVLVVDRRSWVTSTATS